MKTAGHHKYELKAGVDEEREKLGANSVTNFNPKKLTSSLHPVVLGELNNFSGGFGCW
jgi:hypothetical protein